MEGMSVKEAALHLGVDEKTVWTRIKAGTLPALKVSRPQGYTWRVFPDGFPAHMDPGVMLAAIQMDPGVDSHIGPDGSHMDPGADSHIGPDGSHVEAAPLIQLVERLHTENTQLAGQVGFLQAKLQEANERIRLLEAPKDLEAPTDLEPQTKVPWWRRLF